MGKYCGESEAKYAAENGVKIGETAPCKESKGSWWEVYYLDGKIFATVNTDWGVSCGEVVSDDEVKFYVDDVEGAEINIENLKALSHV